MRCSLISSGRLPYYELDIQAVRVRGKTQSLLQQSQDSDSNPGKLLTCFTVSHVGSFLLVLFSNLVDPLGYSIHIRVHFI